MHAHITRLHLVLMLVAAALIAPGTGCSRTTTRQGPAPGPITPGDLPAARSTETGAAGAAPSSAAALPPVIVGGDGAEMLLVPAGTFTMGSADGFPDELPAHEVSVDAFYIDKLEVTNALWGEFVDATGHRGRLPDGGFAEPYGWENGGAPAGKEDHPVALVDWEDARAYAEWAGKRLPTEAEWEMAARGSDGRVFPWGDDPDAAKANIWESGIGKATPVGSYPQGASPFGVMDMAGNVWEWTSDWFDRYPGNDFPSGRYGTTYRVLRGSSWGNVIKYARTFNRHWVEPWTRSAVIGFRCASSPPGR